MRKIVSLVLTFAVLFSVWSIWQVADVSAAPHIQFQKKVDDTWIVVPYTSVVNPGTPMRVRVLGGQGTVKGIRLLEDDTTSPDDDLGPLDFTGNPTDGYVSEPFLAPIIDDVGTSSEIKARVTFSDNSTETSGIINVPEEIKSGTTVHKTTDVGGSVGLDTGLIKIDAKAEHQRKTSFTYKTAMDPSVVVSIIYLTSLPTGWSIYLDPSSFTTSTDKDIDLVIYAPSAGAVQFYVRSYIDGSVEETDPVVVEATAGVGGVVIPIDKFGLLAPCIGLASTILVATVAAVVYVKRVKRRKEKQ
jgi:hypothetical protein